MMHALKNSFLKLMMFWCYLVLTVMVFCFGSAGMIFAFSTMEMAVLGL